MPGLILRRAVKLTETDELSAIMEYDVLAFIESFSKTCEKAPPEYSNEYFPALISKGRTDGEYTWLSYLKKVKNGSIILMHDEFAESVEAALQIVDTLLEEGYCFVTADDLLLE